MASNEKPNSPGVRFPPPLLFIGGLVIAWLLETRLRSWPLGIAPGAAGFFTGAAYVLIAMGFGIMAWAMITFARASTAIIPHRPASRLVDTGPFRLTRNPMYSGMTLAYLGGCFLVGSWWGVVLLPAVLWVLYTRVVRREEWYLAAEFGTAYDDYRRRVKRWV